jgi:CheY-like chemotaxis protein
MSEFQKVLVVDDGARNPNHALSMELAELGFASVTASFEATDDVLDLIPMPAAILLQLPKRSDGARYQRFLELAERLKKGERTSGIPIILVDRSLGLEQGCYVSALQTKIGAQTLHTPER